MTSINIEFPFTDTYYLYKKLTDSLEYLRKEDFPEVNLYLTSTELITIVNLFANLKAVN